MLKQKKEQIFVKILKKRTIYDINNRENNGKQKNQLFIFIMN